jgi:hypothetical protein
MRQFWSMRWNFGQHTAQHLRFEVGREWLYSDRQTEAAAFSRAIGGCQKHRGKAAHHNNSG